MNEAEPTIIFFAILLGVVITLIIITAGKNNQESESVMQYKTDQPPKSSPKAVSSKTRKKSDYLPYHRTNLLTKREYNFYIKKLKPLADAYNLQVLAKIRLADLVEVDEETKEDYKEAYFNKIKAKHIDFAIADNMKIVALVELDDVTHDQPDRIERDKFVDSVVKKCGYTIVHTRDSVKSIENAIKKYNNE